MGRIRIEFVPIKPYGLGWLGFDHLQLVFEPGSSSEQVAQDEWLVLEGNPGRSCSGTILGVPGAGGSRTLAIANLATGAELAALIGLPHDRGSRVLPVEGDPREAWERMAQYARAINDSEFGYRMYGPPGTPFPSVNSSSLIASLLWRIGIDINHHLPAGIGFSPGTGTLLGTGGNDRMALPEAGFDTLVGGAGDDDLMGTNDPARTDKLFGGAGNDVIAWSSGFNIIHGGQPGLTEEDDGFDTVDYRGAGIVTVYRSRRLLPGVLPDLVVTFTGSGSGGGIDWLYSIEALLLDPVSDRLVMGSGAGGKLRALAVDMRGAGQFAGGGWVDLSTADNGVFVKAVGADEIEVSTGETGCGGWTIAGVERLTGTGLADTIQMSRSMRVVEGGAGDDIIDARLVAPGLASGRYGYDAEIDGGDGDDTLIGSRGRTFARGGPGRNTFVLALPGELGEGDRTELIIADAKPQDRLLVQATAKDDRCAGVEARTLFNLTGRGALRGPGGAVRGNGIAFERDGADLVIRINRHGAELARGRTVFGRWREAIVRVLNFQRGDLGIDTAV